MTEAERDVLLDRAREEFEKAKAAYDEDVRAVERVFRLSAGLERQETPNLALTARTDTNAEEGRNGHGERGDTNGNDVSFAERVSRALPTMAHVFNVRDLREAIEAMNPGYEVNANSLSSAMNRLKERGTIEVVRVGGGRTPHEFRLKRAGENTAEEDRLTPEKEPAAVN